MLFGTDAIPVITSQRLRASARSLASRGISSLGLDQLIDSTNVHQFARCFLDGDSGLALAADLIGSDEGRILAQALSASDVGRRLINEVAHGAAGIELALALAASDPGRRLCEHLADGEHAGALAASLIEDKAGVNLLCCLGQTELGQSLTTSFASSPSGHRLLLELADRETGRALAIAFASEEPAATLIRSYGGPMMLGVNLARGLVSSTEGRGVAATLVQKSHDHGLSEAYTNCETHQRLNKLVGVGEMNNTIAYAFKDHDLFAAPEVQHAPTLLCIQGAAAHLTLLGAGGVVAAAAAVVVLRELLPNSNDLEPKRPGYIAALPGRHIPMRDLDLERDPSRRSWFRRAIEHVIADADRLREDGLYLPTLERHEEMTTNRDFLTSYLLHTTDSSVAHAEAERITAQLARRHLAAFTRRNRAASGIAAELALVLAQIAKVDGSHEDNTRASRVAESAEVFFHNVMHKADQAGISLDYTWYEVDAEADQNEGLSELQCCLGFLRRAGNGPNEDQYSDPFLVDDMTGRAIGELVQSEETGMTLGVAMGIVFGWLYGFRDTGHPSGGIDVSIVSGP